MSLHTPASVNYNIHINTQETEDFFKYNLDQCKPRKNFSRRCLFPNKYPSLYIRTKEVLTKGFRKLNKSFSDLKNVLGTSTQVIFYLPSKLNTYHLTQQ